MPDRQRRTVIVFARLPVKGRVKTRLGSSLNSAEAATTFYKACAEHTFRQAASCWADRRVIYHADEADDVGVQSWVALCGLGADIRPQADVPDLGARMQAALAAELQSADQVVLIGSDIPDVDPAVLDAAFQALDAHQLVLGPACDGGFYLIGATTSPPDFLQVHAVRLHRVPLYRPQLLGLTWSTDRVLHDTSSHAKVLGFKLAPLDFLPRLQDIDTAQDLESWVSGSVDHALLVAGTAALAARGSS